MKNLVRSLSVGAVVGTLALLGAPVPAQASTMDMSGTKSCSSQYRVGVRGRNANTVNAWLYIYMPSGTLRKSDMTSGALTYQSSSTSNSWRVRTQAYAGLDISYSGGYCAPPM